MPESSESRKQYENGRHFEKKQDYVKAKEKYEAAAKKLAIAQLAIARLYFEEKIAPENRQCMPQEYQDKGLSLLGKVDKFPDKDRGHYEVRTILKRLKEGFATPELTAKALLIQFKLEKAIGKIIQPEAITNLVKSAIYSKDSHDELTQLLQNLNKHQIKIQRRVYIEAIRLFHTLKQSIDITKAKLNILLFEAIQKIKVQESEFIKGDSFSLAEDLKDIEFIKQNSVLTLNENIDTLYQYVLTAKLDIEWFEKILSYSHNNEVIKELFIKRCVEFLNEHNHLIIVGDEKFIIICCMFAKYLFNLSKYSEAKIYFKTGLDKLTLKHIDYDHYFALYKTTLEKLGELDTLQQHHIASLQNGLDESIYDRACHAYKQWQITKENQLLYNAINDLIEAALSKNAKAIKDISSYCESDDCHPEFLAAKYKLCSIAFDKKIIEIIDAQKIPNGKKGIAKINELLVQAKNAYDIALRENKISGIVTRIAELRYQGSIFEKNDFIARDLYEKAFLAGDLKAAYPLAKMYFYGEGGAVNIEGAYKTLSALTSSQSEQESYLFSEIYYTAYLDAIDHKRDYVNILTQCINSLLYGALKGHKRSLLSLFILHYYDKEIAATSALASLYLNSFGMLPLLSQISFPDFPENKGDYVFEFINTLVKRTGSNPFAEINILYNNYMSKKESHKNKLNLTLQSAKEQFEALFKLTDQVSINAIKELSIQLYSSDLTEYPDIQFLLAHYELKINANAIPMRKLNISKYRDKAIELLYNFYKEHGNDGKYQLITVLCYESARHKLEDAECSIIKDILIKLDPLFTHYTLADFQKYLTQGESQNKRYYDEIVSDDSDSETENVYQAQSKHMTADFPRTNDLVKKIEPQTIALLDKLMELNIDTEEKYKKHVDTIKELFLTAQSLNNAVTTHDENIDKDLQTVNYYAARGQLGEALKLISTKFCLAQTRGIHFKTTLWNQPLRREFRKLARSKDHPFTNLPIYSAAVYDRSGVKNYNDRSEIIELRLSKVAHYIYILMAQLNYLSPHEKSDNAKLPDSAFEYKFTSRNYQIQQIYSNFYDLFHDYIAWEKKSGQDNVFVSIHNSFLSCADIQSSHSWRYAYGNKPYAGHEHERLRPRYQPDGRPLHPYSGATYLTLHPLTDYAKSDHNHVVSLNTHGDVVIDERIVHERENSFFSYIAADRLKLIHIAKFPSFHHPKHLPSDLHKYGLTATLYNKWKKIFAESAPHDFKQRLAILLLGEYLCAYQTLYMTRYAQDRAKKDSQVLLFRDRYGNFSLKPTYDISATPHGDEDSNRLRRNYTASLRQQLRSEKKPRINSMDASENPIAKKRPYSLVANNHFSLFGKNPLEKFLSTSSALSSDLVKATESECEHKKSRTLSDPLVLVESASAISHAKDDSNSIALVEIDEAGVKESHSTMVLN